jgi:hypothetical protein
MIDLARLPRGRGARLTPTMELKNENETIV